MPSSPWLQLASPEPPDRPALAGRGRELAVLHKALARVKDGRGQLVLLGGEAGIGKTALARLVAIEAQATGVRVVTGHCYDLSNAPPYGPWLEIVAGDDADSAWPEPPAAFHAGQVGRVTDQAALFADVDRFVRELSRAGPAYLLFEDLHWADAASIELLRHIAPALRRLPVLTVLTYRVDELTPSTALFGHIPALVREADAVRLEPQRLDPHALRELVLTHYHLRDADETRLVAYLTSHADGNPLFAVELLRALEEGGWLEPADGRWTLRELDHVVVPRLINQVIGGRVAQLDEADRVPLALAAVIGQDVPLALWAELAGLDETGLLPLVERLVNAHLLEASRDGLHVRFVHALTRAAIYESILPPRRREWHRVIGERLASMPTADPDAVALHLQQAGDRRAWEWLVRAGDRAQRLYAWVTAAERLRAAAALLNGVEGQERTYAELMFRVSYLERFSDTAASLRALDDVDRLAHLTGDTTLAAEIEHVRGIQRCYADQFGTGLAAMRRSLESFEKMPPGQHFILLEQFVAGLGLNSVHSLVTQLRDAIPGTTEVNRADDEQVTARIHSAGLDFRRCTYIWHMAAVQQPHKAVALAERLVKLLADVPGVRGGILVLIAFAHHARGIALAALGHPDEARRAWEESRQVFTAAGHHVLMAFTQLHELQDVSLTFGAADPASRRKLAAEAEASLRRAGGALRAGVSPRLAWLGCLLLDGQWDEADAILRDLPAPGNAYLRRPVTAATAKLACHRGAWERAWAEITTILPDGPATPPGNTILQEGLFLQRLAVELCLDTGDHAAAHDWLDAHDRWLTWSGSELGRAEGRLLWARWHRSNGDLSAARSVATDVLALATSPEQPLTTLASQRLLGELDAEAGDMAGAEAHLVASLDLARRCEAPFERALALTSLAEVRLAAGAREAARALIEEARAILVPLGARPALAKMDSALAKLAMQRDAPPLAGLTRREVEVLRLLSHQRTDREIAEALFISPHTASTHVKHVLAKLGVASRRDAAEVAVANGIV